MNIFSLFNDEEKQEKKNDSTLRFSINGSDYVVYADGSNSIYRSHLGEYHEGFCSKPDAHGKVRYVHPRQEKEEDSLTIESETQYPGVYKCVYKSKYTLYDKDIVFYIGLDFKKALTDERYIVYLYDIVLKAAKIFEDIYGRIQVIDDFGSDKEQVERLMNNSTINNIISNRNNIGNYIGSIIIESNGSLVLSQDEQIYEFSKDTPEMYELRQNLELIKLKKERNINSEVLRLFAEITTRRVELKKLEYEYDCLAKKYGLPAYDNDGTVKRI